MTQITIGFFGQSGGGTNSPTLQSSVVTPTPDGDHALTFSEPRKVGQYPTGSWWILGTTTVTAVAPVGACVVISPSAGTRDHGYFLNLFGTSNTSFYKPALNKSAMPQTLNPGDVMIVAMPGNGDGTPPNLLSGEVFMCVAEEPSSNEFRPPYINQTQTPKVFTEAMIDMSRLDDRVSSALLATHGITVESMLPKLQRPWLDHIQNWLGRYAHPAANMPDYGGPIAEELGSAMLLANSDLPNVVKYPIVRQLCQIGIEFWELYRNGHEWEPDGGHAAGRLPTILFAKHVLNQPEMNSFTYTSDRFGEPGQCFIVAETSPGVYNLGYGDYIAADVGLPDWGIRHVDFPGFDSRWWNRNADTHTGSATNVSGYRRSSTTTYWYGQALSLRLMGLISEMGPGYGPYMDRYANQMPVDPFTGATYPVNEHYRNSGHWAAWQALRATL